MRVPDFERRRFRARRWWIALAFILLVGLFSLRGLAVFYTEFLWFDSVGQGSTWGRLLSAKVIPALVFTVAFFLVVLVNLVIAERLAPRLRLGALTPEDEMVDRYRASTARYAGRIRLGVALLFALMLGLGVSAQWRDWILFTHRVDFGRVDPQFHKDIGFYVFQLPFLRFIVDWLFAGLMILLLVTVAAHWLNGGIRFQSAAQRVTPQVKAHLSVVLAVMALVKTAGYYLSRFELNLSTRGAVDGASYTDVKAQLPAINMLVVISVVAAGLFLWNIRRRGWVLPVIAVGLWGFVAIALGTVYPAIVQNLKVKPNEFALETPYIRRNIVATRAVFGLKGVEQTNFSYQSDISQDVVDANRATISNACLWDPDVAQSTFANLQAFQSYYGVNSVDIDRYVVDGGVEPVLIAPRELNSSALPSQSWINQRLVYTHGYGIVAAAANTAVADGTPEFISKDIPVVSTALPQSKQGASIYFSERQSDYVIVGARQKEFNYPRQGAADAATRYTGKDGVALSNVLRRAAFALRFSDPNLLVSGQVTSSSRIVLYRSIRSRVQKLAPFLKFDADPYPVVANGRTVWMLDGYTTTDQYPYAQSVSGSGGLNSTFNYVRNSVKVTVDAYDGRVGFYVIDPTDPIIRAYQKAFPDLFSPFSQMPDALKDHLRYPQDLFDVQTNVFSKYHVVQTRRFFQGSERWLITPDPNEAVSGNQTGASSSSGKASTGRAPEITATTKRQAPAYLYIRLPQDTAESFLLLQAFVPVSQNNQQTRLVSFMTAKSDRDNYGKLQSFVMPQGQTVLGPVQALLKINQQPVISSQFTLLDQAGSRLIKGAVQLIPVGTSIVYIQPIYIEGSGTSQFPQYRFVAVFAQDHDPVLASSVDSALQQIFGSSVNPTTPTSPTNPTTPGAGSTVSDLLAQAAQKFNEADAALKAGNLGAYQSLVQEAQALVSQAQQLLNGGSTPASTPASTTTTSTTRAK